MDEYPHLKSCLSTVAYIGGVNLFLLLIAVAFGTPAAFWFGLGALLTCIVALWEAGGKKVEE